MSRLPASEKQRCVGVDTAAQMVRQHAPDSPDNENCYGRHEESKSMRGVLDDTFRHTRMTAFTSERQTLVMLGFMLARNTLARHALSMTRQQAA